MGESQRINDGYEGGPSLDDCLRHFNFTSNPDPAAAVAGGTGSLIPVEHECIDPSLLTTPSFHTGYLPQDQTLENLTADGGGAASQSSHVLDSHRPEGSYPSNDCLGLPTRRRPRSQENMKRKRTATPAEEPRATARKHPKPDLDHRRNAQKLVQCWLQNCFDSREFYFPSKKDIGNLAALAKVEYAEAESLVHQELRSKPSSARFPFSPPPTEPRAQENNISEDFARFKQTAVPDSPTHTEIQQRHRPPRSSQLVSQSSRAGPLFTTERKHQMVRQYLATRTRECNTGQRHCNNEGAFQCTAKCGFRAAVVDSWKRHEENRQPQALWICKICRETPSMTSPFISHRVDKIGDHVKAHVKREESGLSWQTLREQSSVGYPLPFKKKCGFCRTKFGTWAERNRHIIAHFSEDCPRDIHDWNDEWRDGDETGGDDGSDSGDSDSDGDGDGGDGGDDGRASKSGPSSGFSTMFPFSNSGSGFANHNTGNEGHGGPGDFTHARWGGSAMAFRTGKILGQGSHATVEQIRLNTGEELALKQSKPVNAAAIARFEREARILGKLKLSRHPNVISLQSAWREETSLNLVLRPVASSDLQRYLHSRGPQEKPESVMPWFAHLASALQHLHKNRIRHADIKPANVLLEDSRLFISDFSISREVVSEPDSTSSSNSPNTPLYAAPEIALAQRHGRKADVFSLGCVYLELVTFTLLGTLAGLYAYLGITSTAAKRRVTYHEKLHLAMKWIVALRQRSEQSYGPLLDLCGSMLERMPAMRPSSARIVEITATMCSPHSSECKSPMLGWCTSGEKPGASTGMRYLCVELSLSGHGGELETQDRSHSPQKTDPIREEFHRAQRAHGTEMWPYKTSPNSTRLIDSYKGPRRQRDFDLIGLDDQSLTDALPVYPGALDCVLSTSEPLCSTDGDVFAKVLQPDSEYGQLPHERWLRGTSSPLYLPTERLPRRRPARPGPWEASEQTVPAEQPQDQRPSALVPWPSDNGAGPSPWNLRKGPRSWGSRSIFAADDRRVSTNSTSKIRTKLHKRGMSAAQGSDDGRCTSSSRREGKSSAKHCSGDAARGDLRHQRSSTSLGSDFKPYGRHANQWLFGDFSVRAAVKDALGRTGKRRRTG